MDSLRPLVALRIFESSIFIGKFVQYYLKFISHANFAFELLL